MIRKIYAKPSLVKRAVLPVVVATGGTPVVPPTGT